MACLLLVGSMEAATAAADALKDANVAPSHRNTAAYQRPCCRSGALAVSARGALLVVTLMVLGVKSVTAMDHMGGAFPGPDDDSPRAAEFIRAIHENARATLDVSTRGILSTRDGDAHAQEFVGIDVHKVVSDRGRDWATLRLQVYGDRLDGSGEHRWRHEFRFFDLNLTRFGRNGVNLRLGHFELPYGLEELLDTNGTLRDFIHVRNLGVKADWGASLNGVFPRLEYEIAVTQGSGNDFSTHDDRFIAVGRVGTPRDDAIVLGLSGFHGRVEARDSPPTQSSGRGRIVSRNRAGIDAQLYRGLAGLLADVSFGDDDGFPVLNGLVELDWRSRSERFFGYLQTRYFTRRASSGWSADVQNIVGAQYVADAHWSVAAELAQDLMTAGDAARTGTVRVQARYRL